MNGENEKEVSLSSLLDEDKERLISQIDADRSAEHVSGLLEKEVDRLLMRYSQLPAAQAKLPAAQQMLQTVRSSLPVVETVTDAEVWRKDQTLPKHRNNPAGFIFLLAGALLTLIPVLAHPSSIVYTLAGIGCMFLGGFLLGRGSRDKDGENHGFSDRRGGRKDGQDSTRLLSNENVKYLVDTETVFRSMKQITMTIDGILNRMQTGQPHDEYDREGCLPASGKEGRTDIQTDAQLDFFSELLENAYASKNHDKDSQAAAEQIEMIRYYLYRQGIGIEDYGDDTDAGHFEFLPSGGNRTTIRPALVRDGKLLKRGLASQ